MTDWSGPYAGEMAVDEADLDGHEEPVAGGGHSDIDDRPSDTGGVEGRDVVAGDVGDGEMSADGPDGSDVFADGGAGSAVSGDSGAGEDATEGSAGPETGAAGDPGDQVIDRLTGRLRELDELPIGEHPARYEALHAELSEALTALDRAARAVPDEPAAHGQSRR